jgi:pyrroline-5-carboxylate reductase
MQYKLGFLGAGAMAGAILDNAIDNADTLGISPDALAVYDIDVAKREFYAKKGVSIAGTAAELFKSCEIVLLGVKPQYYAAILAEVGEYSCKAIASIMAGVKISTLRKIVGNEMGIIRIMPNMPCRIGEGMSALAFDKTDKDTAAFVTAVFGACGKTIVISEDKFDAVTSISGSGPAYVYLFAAGLIKGGMEGGLTEAEARLLALQTLKGASMLAAADDTALDTLVDRVCSKGGTTIEAIDYYRAADLPGIIGEGVRRCREKSKLLSDKL